jgi:hypothetical protein
MMATETRLIALPCDEDVAELIADIESAKARAAKADPADRSDIVRYEALSVRLEQRATVAWGEGAWSVPVAAPASAELPSFLLPEEGSAPPTPLPEDVRAEVAAQCQQGCAVVCVTLPFAADEEREERVEEPITAAPPAERWHSAEGLSGRRAVEERFRDQLKKAAVASASAATPTISPSGIQNSVVTEILREFVDVDDGGSRVDVAVEYRDGSRAQNHLPLRALRLADGLPAQVDLSLRLAMLSIRHTEMDVVVDGAWLRNAEISRPRPAAQTDDLVFEISRAQLEALTLKGSRTLQLHIFQTGLETAVLGFYRAVVHHLLEHPGSLWVVPMYHQTPPRPRPGKGKKKKGVAQSRSPFRPGLIWAT